MKADSEGGYKYEMSRGAQRLHRATTSAPEVLASFITIFVAKA